VLRGNTHCTTCQKAVAHLEAKGVSIRAWRNLEQPLSEDEVRALAAKVDGMDRLFSKRAMKYRQMGLHERELSDDDLVRLMAEEYTFVTRP
jgi:arsenate reductase